MNNERKIYIRIAKPYASTSTSIILFLLDGLDLCLIHREKNIGSSSQPSIDNHIDLPALC